MFWITLWDRISNDEHDLIYKNKHKYSKEIQTNVKLSLAAKLMNSCAKAVSNGQRLGVTYAARSLMWMVGTTF